MYSCLLLGAFIETEVVWFADVFIGAAGWGAVVQMPCAPNNGNTALRITNASMGDSPGANMNYASVNFPAITNNATPSYTVGTGMGDAKFKLVAMGLEMEYVGKLVDMNGSVYIWNSPGNQGILTNTVTPIAVSALPLNRVEPVRQNKKYTSTWFPQDESDYTVSTNAYLTNSSEVGTNGFIMFGEPGTQFHVKFAYHWEVINNSPFSTPSHSNPGQFAKVQTARQTAYITKKEPTPTNIIQQATEWIGGVGDTLTSMYDTAMNVYNSPAGRMIRNAPIAGLLTM
jgi:hypothetical protein